MGGQPVAHWAPHLSHQAIWAKPCSPVLHLSSYVGRVDVVGTKRSLWTPISWFLGLQSTEQGSLKAPTANCFYLLEEDPAQLKPR